MSDAWTVTNCGNLEHGPEMFCHRVMDATGKVLLQSVDRATADTFASVPVLRAQVRTLEADNAAIVQRGQHLLAEDAEMHDLMERVTRAERALTQAGWTYTNGAEEWCPPLGPDPRPMLAEMDSLRAEVKRLTEERDETGRTRDEVVASFTAIRFEAKGLRARVAELESRYAKSEKERGLALIAKQEHERAARLARDAALEEAKARLGKWHGLRDGMEEYGSVSGRMVAALDDLKSQPGRRFVDAEEVGPVLDLADQGLRNAISYGLPLEHHQEAVSKLLERLGLTLDGENATPVRVIGVPPKAPRPEPMLMLSCPGFAVGLSYTYVNHIARCGGWSDRDSAYQEQDGQMRDVIDEAVRLLGRLGEKR